MRHVRVRGFLLAIGVILLASAPVFSDPPSVVGRLNLAVGPVSFLPGSLDQWAPAVTNYPLSAGDRVWTDQAGRAEIHVGSTALRLDSGTEMSFLTLDDQTVQVGLSQGSLNIRVRLLEQGDTWEVDTPNSVITLLQPGSYRVDATPGGEVSVTVRAGLAEVAAANDTFDVSSNESAHISGTDSVAYWVQPAPRPDPWDSWAFSRDAREENLASLRYVPREMIGMEDLDDNGTWFTVGGFGPVWSPTRVPAGWAPYRFGRWAWVAPWGWTWIDDAPWGFTPFHYGRWALWQSRWVWIPGAIVNRPVYAPALVVFVGGGSPEDVGWFPLGPREVYVPPYQASTSYAVRINITSVTNVTVQVIQQINVTRTVYVNRTAPSAMTILPRQAFVQSRPTSETVFKAAAPDPRGYNVIGMDARLTPERESVFGQRLDPQRPATKPPEAIQARPVYSRITPAPVPQPFMPAQGSNASTRMQQSPQAQQPQQIIQPRQQAQPGVIVVTPENRVQNPPATRAETTPSPALRPGTPARPAATNDRAGTPAQPAATNDRAGTGADPQPLLTTLSGRSLPAAESRLESARKMKDIRLDYNGLRKQLADVRALIAAAQRDLKAGRKDVALTEATDAQRRIDQIEKIIADALKQAGAGSDSRGQGQGPGSGGGPGQGRPTSP